MANTFIVTGRLSEPVDLKTSQKGNTYASVILVNNEGDRSNHIPMVAFNDLAKQLQNVSTKTPILATATVTSRTYNGFPRLNIYLNNFELLTEEDESLPASQPAKTSTEVKKSAEKPVSESPVSSAAAAFDNKPTSTSTSQPEADSNTNDDLDDFNFDDFDFE